MHRGLLALYLPNIFSFRVTVSCQPWAVVNTFLGMVGSCAIKTKFVILLFEDNSYFVS